MDWSTVTGVATTLLSGNWIAILVTVLVAFGLPALLHLLLYKSSPSAQTNNFLLLGPSGSGKTAFCSLLEQKSSSSPKLASETHTSQTSVYISAVLPSALETKSNRYRSVNDPSLSDASKNAVRYQIRDTPGHGKLRSAEGIAQLSAMSDLKKPKTNARGIIYMVDAATLSESESLSDAVAYLHDILLLLQERVASKKIPSIPVLIAANKQDLFTALPANAVKEKLEAEIERFRQSKRKGLLDASANLVSGDEEPEILGGDEGHGRFTFNLLEEELGMSVDVRGGAVIGDEANPAAGVQRWEEWIASCL